MKNENENENKGAVGLSPPLGNASSSNGGEAAAAKASTAASLTKPLSEATSSSEAETAAMQASPVAEAKKLALDPQGKGKEEPEKKKEHKIAKLKWHDKTTGEKWYGVLRFAIGKVSIMIITAAIAYAARRGPDSKWNVVRKIDKYLLEKFAIPLDKAAQEIHQQYRAGNPDVGYWKSKRADTKLIFGGSLVGSVTLFWGGVVFAPIMKWLENSKKKISNAINKRWGKPREVELAHEHLKDDPKQTWGDVIKGRVAAFITVFTSFSAACVLFGRVKTPNNKGEYLLKFDWYEQKVGRLIAGITKKGRDIAKTPMAITLTPEQDRNVLYQLGKISALDFYATSAAIAIWTVVSRFSARKKKEKIIAAREQQEAVDKEKFQGAGGQFGGAGASTTWGKDEVASTKSTEPSAHPLKKDKNNPMEMEQELSDKSAKHADGFVKTGSYTQTAETRKESSITPNGVVAGV